MANLASKKSDFLSNLVIYAAKAEGLVREIAELNSYFTDNGFAAGGANALTDADCTGDNSHLSAALVSSAMTAIATVNLSPAQKTIMRQVSKTVIP